VINGRLSEAEQRIVAIHEAAHLLIHPKEIVSSPFQALRDFHLFDSSGLIEHQANLFSADYLLEDKAVLDLVYGEQMDFFNTAGTLSVPAHLLAFKLYSMMWRGYNVRMPVDLDSRFLRK